MKLVKSLLLGSAAGLAVVGGAQAADLPVKKAVPIEYVRVCSAYGVTFSDKWRCCLRFMWRR